MKTYVVYRDGSTETKTKVRMIAPPTSTQSVYVFTYEDRIEFISPEIVKSVTKYLTEETE